MATLTITVPDADVPRIRAAFAERAFWRTPPPPQSVPDPIPPATAEQVRQEIILWMKAEVKRYEAAAATKTAVDAVPEFPAT